MLLDSYERPNGAGRSYSTLRKFPMLEESKLMFDLFSFFFLAFFSAGFHTLSLIKTYLCIKTWGFRC